MERVKIKYKDVLLETFKGLKPCPFCGGEGVYINQCGDFVISPSKPVYERLVCWDCGIGTTSYPKDSMEDCFNHWNTRA